VSTNLFVTSVPCFSFPDSRVPAPMGKRVGGLALGWSAKAETQFPPP
jgi:hypothetical protein